MTRAKDQLTLGLPLRFYVSHQARGGDRHVYALRTRFIPEEILNRFDVLHLAPDHGGPDWQPSPGHIDGAASLRQMWG